MSNRSPKSMRRDMLRIVLDTMCRLHMLFPAVLPRQSVCSLCYSGVHVNEKRLSCISTACSCACVINNPDYMYKLAVLLQSQVLLLSEPSPHLIVVVGNLTLSCNGHIMHAATWLLQMPFCLICMRKSERLYSLCTCAGHHQAALHPEALPVAKL